MRDTYVSQTIRNEIGEIAPLLDAVRLQLAQAHVADKAVFDITLAIDELVTNIISYAYKDDGVHSITVTVAVGAAVIEVTIDDDGRAFDPFSTERPAVDTTQPIAEREIGGLGLHLVRQLMDRVAYRRTDGRNHVTLQRRVMAGPDDAPHAGEQPPSS